MLFFAILKNKLNALVLEFSWKIPARVESSLSRTSHHQIQNVFLPPHIAARGVGRSPGPVVIGGQLLVVAHIWCERAKGTCTSLGIAVRGLAAQGPPAPNNSWVVCCSSDTASTHCWLPHGSQRCLGWCDGCCSSKQITHQYTLICLLSECFELGHQRLRNKPLLWNHFCYT